MGVAVEIRIKPHPSLQNTHISVWLSMSTSDVALPFHSNTNNSMWNYCIDQLTICTLLRFVYCQIENKEEDQIMMTMQTSFAKMREENLAWRDEENSSDGYSIKNFMDYNNQNDLILYVCRQVYHENYCTLVVCNQVFLLIQPIQWLAKNQLKCCRTWLNSKKFKNIVL